MRKRGVVILMAAALTASVPATALADQFAGQIALNGEAASEDVADEESQVDMDQTEEADKEDHEEPEDVGLKETDEAGTEESDPEEAEPEESEEEVKDSENLMRAMNQKTRMLTQRAWNRKKMSWRTKTQKKLKRRR